MITVSERQGLDLTVGNVPKLLAIFAFPMLIAGFLQMANIFVTTIYVGNYLGKVSLAAITLSMPIIFILIAAANGFTLASSVIISQNIGRKNVVKTEQAVQTSISIIIIIGLCIFVLGQLLTPGILHILGAHDEVHATSLEFMRIIWFSVPFITLQALFTAMLRGMGNSTTPLYYQALSVVIAVIFMPIFIKGSLFFHLPDIVPAMGLNGGGIVMSSAAIISTIALGLHMQTAKYTVSPKWSKLYIRRDIFNDLVKIGVPAAFQQAIVATGMTVVLGIVASFGDEVTAAYGVASRIDNLAFLPAMSIGMAIASITGQNLGAGKVDRVKEIFKWGMIFCLTLTVFAAGIAIIFPQFILGLFVNDTDADVLKIGVDYLRIVGFAYPFFAVTFISNGVINGAGKTIIITFISLINLWILRVPLAYFLSKWMGSERGVWWTLAISFLIAAVLSFTYYKFGNWKKEFIKPEEQHAVQSEII